MFESKAPDRGRCPVTKAFVQEALRGGVRQTRIPVAGAIGLTTDEREELGRQRMENAELERANAILKRTPRPCRSGSPADPASMTR